jgi:uncharacterized membrane protein YhdT
MIRPAGGQLPTGLPATWELAALRTYLVFLLTMIIIVRVQLIQLLRGLVTNNFEPENSMS